MTSPASHGSVWGPTVAVVLLVAAAFGVIVRWGPEAGTHAAVWLTAVTRSDASSANARPHKGGQGPDLPYATGDVLFRLGRGVESWAVRQIDTDTPYSHVGIVEVVGGDVFVHHVVPTASGVSREPIGSFLSADAARAGALYRYHPPLATPFVPAAAHSASETTARPGKPKPVPETAVVAAHRFARRGVDFDTDYNVHTDDAMYCTEFVWQAYRAAKVDLRPPTARRAPRVVLGCPSPCLLPSHLLASSHLREVARFARSK